MKKLINIVLPVMILALLAVMLVSSLQENNKPSNPVGTVRHVDTPATPTVVRTTQYELEPKTLNELLDIPSDQLHRVDVARMNLLCATQLPSTESLDVEHALATLDEWAKRVAFETDRHLYRVTDPSYADYYHNSEAYFRAEMLKQVLMEDCGLKYNMNRALDVDFTQSKDLFIHGMVPQSGQSVTDVNGGTCVSMPVIYAAVGRRLGYPIKIALTEMHIFARWDGKASGGHSNPAWRERFNIETTNEGMDSFDDDYYLTWPIVISKNDAAHRGYLRSLSSADELAQFMGSRGHCLHDNGDLQASLNAYAAAKHFDPRRPRYAGWFTQVNQELNPERYGHRKPHEWWKDPRAIEAGRLRVEAANARTMEQARQAREAARPPKPQSVDDNYAGSQYPQP